ncbi:MAG: chemotaxis protein CheW [Pseudomonadota bacterium]
MNVLVFHIGPDRYGLPLTAIARVLPAVELKHIPLAPAWVAGLLDFHGAPVPVLDLSRLAGLAPQQACFDSRIVLAHYQGRLLGLLAEHVVGTLALDAARLADSGVKSAPFLGQVSGLEGGMLQLVDVTHLLSDEVRALLFPARDAA